MKCKTSGCNRDQKCRGHCSMHYERLRAAGDLPIRKLGASKAERVWRFIDKRDDSECWPWTGKCVDGGGYGVVILGPGKRQKAHRAMWEITHGPIPPGEGYHGTVVMHVCDNRICCNPAHLRLGTQGDNTKDMVAKGRNVPAYDREGANHPMASPLLNDEAIREIRRAKGRREIVDMACKYDLEITNVYQIRSRRTWKHVT